MAEEKNSTPVTDEIATTRKDLDIFAGWLNRLENPDPTLRTESGGKGLKLYDEVDRDPHAGAVLQTRYLSVAGREWEVLPADETPKAVEIAEFVKSAIEGANFTRTVQELLQAVLYGFYVGEVMWTAQKGRWVPRLIMGKHPRRFSFTMDREPRLLTPQDMIEGEPVPDRKFIVFTWGSSDNPYGKGLGQKLWWPVWFKKNGIKFWLVFLEKFGMPTAVGKYPTGTLPDQQQALLDAIDAIQHETGVKIPDNMAIELLEAARSGKVTYETLCEYMDKQVSKAVLGQTATTEGTPGKLGNEDAQEEVRADILKADADLLCECLNQTLVRWIVDYNFADVTDYPTLWIRTEAEKDLLALAERDKIIAVDMGMAKRIPERYIEETYNIPLAEEGDPVIGADEAKIFEYHLKYGTITINEIRARQGLDPRPGGDVLIEPVAGPAGGAFAEGGADIAEIYTARAEEEADDPAGAFVEPVRALINSAGSLADVRDGLFDLYPGMDAGRLGTLMQRAFAAAELAGRMDVTEEI